MKFCLDSNVLIEAWNGYYAPGFCKDYWKCLEELSDRGSIFVTEKVFREIEKRDDELFKWVKQQKELLVREISKDVESNLQRIYLSERNRRLIDSIKGRSIADPWVIAHAMAEKATVVTKENYESNPTKRIKIPNVCEEMGVPWMNDFEFIREVKIFFSAELRD